MRPRHVPEPNGRAELRRLRHRPVLRVWGDDVLQVPGRIRRRGHGDGLLLGLPLGPLLKRRRQQLHGVRDGHLRRDRLSHGVHAVRRGHLRPAIFLGLHQL